MLLMLRIVIRLLTTSLKNHKEDLIDGLFNISMSPFRISKPVSRGVRRSIQTYVADYPKSCPNP